MIERIQAQGLDVQTVKDIMSHTGSELLSVPIISSEMLHAIRSALLTGEDFTFNYKKVGQKRPQTRRVKVTSFDGVYVTGIDLDKGEDRQYRVDRISL